MTPDEFRDTVNRLTIIVSFTYTTDMETGYSDFTLHIASDNRAGASSVILKFSGVKELRMKLLGGGIQQFMMLEIEDIRDLQLDRVNYRLRELEHDAISCMFLDVEVIRPIE